MKISRREWVVWATLLLGANLGVLLGGEPAVELGFDWTAVAAGEWWRLATYPLVHVGAYHFWMDAGAFLILYGMLEGRRGAERLALVAAASAGALIAAWPEAVETGLTGLSGVAHGLMAVIAMDQVGSTDRVTRRIGGLSLGFVLVKALIEAATGHVVLGFLHLGEIGAPVAACHAGGVGGGLAGWAGGRFFRACRVGGGCGSFPASGLGNDAKDLKDAKDRPPSNRMPVAL